MLMAFHLEKRWKKLFSSALYRSKTLHSTKVKFTQMTANDIEKFKQEVSTFRAFKHKLEFAQQHFIFGSEKIDDKTFMSSTLCIHFSLALSIASLLRKNIVKVLLNILSMKPCKHPCSRCSRVGERMLNLLNNE